MRGLLPRRVAFIKSLQPCPADAAVLQQLCDHWLGCYGLLLPSCFPFMVGVAAHPEAEEASLQVGYCLLHTVLLALVVQVLNISGETGAGTVARG